MVETQSTRKLTKYTVIMFKAAFKLTEGLDLVFHVMISQDLTTKNPIWSTSATRRRSVDETIRPC